MGLVAEGRCGCVLFMHGSTASAWLCEHHVGPCCYQPDSAGRCPATTHVGCCRSQAFMRGATTFRSRNIIILQATPSLADAHPRCHCTSILKHVLLRWFLPMPVHLMA